MQSSSSMMFQTSPSGSHRASSLATLSSLKTLLTSAASTSTSPMTGKPLKHTVTCLPFAVVRQCSWDSSCCAAGLWTWTWSGSMVPVRAVTWRWTLVTCRRYGCSVIPYCILCCLATCTLSSIKDALEVFSLFTVLKGNPKFFIYFKSSNYLCAAMWFSLDLFSVLFHFKTSRKHTDYILRICVYS